MKSWIIQILLLALSGLLAQPAEQWKPHDRNRPQPGVVDPDAKQLPSKTFAPSDAVVLFDGSDFSNWQSIDGGVVEWKRKEEYMQVVKGSGAIQTKQHFGNCQLHIEWATPEAIQGNAQGRGNSGVFFMSRYEVQVLDSYNNQTYPDGQAAAIYGQYPPLVNASRPPGEWQTYDIVFYRPVFDRQGILKRPAAMTVFHNGILVQHNAELIGSTVSGKIEVHGPKGPVMLQDHSNPVRYRNIWIREIEERQEIFAPLIFPSEAIVDDTNPLQVKMRSVPHDLQIRYTLDGSEPNRFSRLYDNPFLIEHTTIIKARAFTSSMDSSLVSVSDIQYVDPKVNGIYYWLYTGMWQQLPDFAALSPQKQGVVYDPALDRIQTPAEGFALLFRGYLRIIKEGDYTFYLRSDDGSRLIIGDHMVVDHDGVHGPEQKLGTIHLSDGYHSFELTYFQEKSGHSLQVLFEGPEITRQPLPANLLYLEPPAK
ncbi:DUF1080 domain-containing protein [candidate division KSB1 bacterium]|nr:DUF1080 domain-containing protein [candidate division KSB1 bacterium]